MNPTAEITASEKEITNHPKTIRENRTLDGNQILKTI